MTSALLLALRADTHGEPTCLQSVAGEPILVRVVRQLRGLGVGRVTVVSHHRWDERIRGVVDAEHATIGSLPEALAALRRAGGGPGDLVVAHADVVTHDGALAGLLRDPRITTGILADTTSGPRGRLEPRVRVSRGRVVAAESAYHDLLSGENRFLGVLKVAEADLASLTAVCQELASVLADGVPDDWRAAHRAKLASWATPVAEQRGTDATIAMLFAGRDDQWGRAAAELRAEVELDVARRVVGPLEDMAADPLPLALVGLVRRDVVVGAAWVRELYWGRPTEAAEAAAAQSALERIDEDRVQLDSAVKASDGFFTTFLVSPYSRYIARWAAHRGLTPNQVTSFSMVLGLLAAAAFATGRQPWMVVGALLLQAAFTFDCVDGQLARYTRSFSKLGAWLDSVFDRGKEYVVYAGLAIGASAASDDVAVWALATAVLALQAFRHFVDFSYAAQQHLALAGSVAAPLERPSEAALSRWETFEEDAPRTFLQRIGAAGVRASQAAEATAWMKWAKRAFVLPIGERFALISVTAAIWGARTTFAALLVWGSVAALYTITGRVARSLV